VSDFLLLFGPALAALAACACAAPLVGAFLHARGSAILGLALPQAALLGLVVGQVLVGHTHTTAASLAPLFGSAVAVVLALVLLYTRERSSGSEASRAAAVFVVAGAAVVLVGHLAPAGALEVEALMRGEILGVGSAELAVVLTTALLVVAHVAWRWRFIAAVGEDRVAAALHGCDVRREELAFAAAVAAVAVVCTATLGPLPLFALLVLPPLGVQRMAWSTVAFLVLSVLVGLVGSGVGALIAFEIDAPLGASVVLGNAVVALLVRRFA
jgi:zinc/manganese transport system permease protein